MEECYGIIYFLEITNKYLKIDNKKITNKINEENQIKSGKNLIDKKIEKNNIKEKIVKYIKQIISISISVQIIIIPIMIYNYKTISLTFLITNILASFIITLIIILGIILIIISFISIKISKILGWIYLQLIKIFLLIVENTSKIPFSKIYIKTPEIYQIILYYILVFIIRLFNKNK